MKTHLEDLFTALYESEINLEFSWVWDGGFDVRIGDRLNGFVAEKTFQNWPGVMQEIEEWIVPTVRAAYPSSYFARHLPR